MVHFSTRRWWLPATVICLFLLVAAAPVTATPAGPSVASGTWKVTASMSTSHQGHTATRLLDGRVLVAAGGYWKRQSFSYLSSAEVYDPAAETWSATGSMTTARFWHTATLLRNGQVLVGGGFGSGGCCLSSAEVYDPRTGTWSATGSLTDARYVHTATRLPSGQVLVAGGCGSSCYPGLSSAEVYFP